MEPLLPDGQEALLDLAFQITKVSARTAGHVHPIVFAEVVEHLRIINSYYSNLIEGNPTHPVEIERAMHADYSGDPAKRALQQESLAHIEVQQLLAQRLQAEPALDVTAPEFLCWLHEQFYLRMPQEFRYVTHPHSGERFEVIPGALREQPVEVGIHIAPEAASLPRFLEGFHEVYRLERHHGGEQRLIAAAAAHHRLGWIHPFLDGNGRVMRLFTDAYLHQAGLEGCGLWTISRGLARNIPGYKAHLANADRQRQGDYDGRGNLSMSGLRQFCEFFLRNALDQAEYMSGMLRLDALAGRINGYVDLRMRGLVAGAESQVKLDQQATAILHAVLLHGELSRGEAGRASGFAERKAGLIIKQLLDEGLLRSDTQKGAVRLGFPAYALPYIFPDLIPTMR
jgi:Fic family protein